MSNFFWAWLQGWDIVLILVVVLILFGAKKLPELARGLGQGIREFKKSTREVQDELENAMDVNAPPPPPRPQRLPADTQPRTSEPAEHSSTEAKV